MGIRRKHDIPDLVNIINHFRGYLLGASEWDENMYFWSRDYVNDTPWLRFIDAYAHIHRQNPEWFHHMVFAMLASFYGTERVKLFDAWQGVEYPCIQEKPLKVTKVSGAGTGTKTFRFMGEWDQIRNDPPLNKSGCLDGDVYLVVSKGRPIPGQVFRDGQYIVYQDGSWGLYVDLRGKNVLEVEQDAAN